MEDPGIISTSVAEGYPYADVKQMGMSFLAIADGDLDLAREKAVWMAERAWERRAEMHIHVPSVREALEMAGSHADAKPDAGPVVLMDVGDNIGGGSSADSTYILDEAQRMGVQSFLQSLYDPEAVGRCVEAGVGGEVSIEVGAKTDDLHGKPVAVSGRVTRLSEGKYEDTRPTHGGYRFFDGGTTAVLETPDDHTLVVDEQAGRQHVTGTDVLGGNPAGAVQGGSGEGRCFASPCVSADSVADHPGKHARRDDGRHDDVYVSPPPETALPVRNGRRVHAVKGYPRPRSGTYVTARDNARGFPFSETFE